jgi:hypothetical protein
MLMGKLYLLKEWYKPKTENQFISEIINDLAQNNRYMQVSNLEKNLTNYSCALCLKPIDGIPVELKSKEDKGTHYLDNLCVDSLLFAADIQTNIHPYCSINNYKLSKIN